MKTSTVVSTIFLLSCGSVVVAEIEIIWVSVSFEIDKAEETTFVSTFNSLATLYRTEKDTRSYKAFRK